MKTKVLFVFLVSALLVATRVKADESYRSGYEPPVPEAFPQAYKDYQILPGTISPDGKLALIYPKRSVLGTPDKLDGAGLYLAQLKPFAIIVELEYDNICFNHGGYDSDWAKDGTAFVFEEMSKWGPDRVSLVPIQNGKAGKILDLTAEVRKKVKPYFSKAHEERYNDYYDYIFDADETNRWHPINGKVEIDVTCTTEPRPAAKKWTAKFEGTWDIGKGRFLHFKVQNVPNHYVEEEQ
jgi:hypothetical protein